MATKEGREFDLVVFGATGVTGQYVVEEVARIYKEENIKWAVAGRNVDKLRNVLTESANNVGEGSLDGVSVIQVDVKDEDSVYEMCKQTRLVLNTVGPYRFYGEPVVKACVASGTHHLDVSGEPQYLEKMQLKYFEEAKEAGIYVIGACGFDSIPAEMGISFLKQKFDGDVNSVETFMSLKNGPKGSKVNFGTWQSAIYGLAHASELKSLRKQLNDTLFQEPLPKSNFPLKRRGVLFKSDVVNGWCIPFLGSDRSVVLRSQMFGFNYLKERPVQVQTYFHLSSLLACLVTMFMATIFFLMASNKCGRYLLEKFPGFFSLGTFSRGGPTREQVKDNSFTCTIHGEGWTEKLTDPTDQHKDKPDKNLTIVVKGPDAAYLATSIFLVHCGLTTLKDEDKMPGKGGVLTPGAAFAKTSLLGRLQSRGIDFIVNDP
ncbi:saccharopine dehydrogenase-like oxidoreductase isoform X2 [Limulus polyphemus]|uniref:Saccharopine dehydrogenase-like oxidoreductase isoform X2 n=1 Tax=Limulus polyphemus TaxID=6850 RepID=A0ABM1BPA4_LIMPO|nr:saccharopine dehydrogenase-like oxidoreductase isoform X2 [Limulus polyphemus]